jgi:transcriptional regulator with XRE-family HTH domain
MAVQAIAYESQLKERRLEEGLSRKALARRANCASSTIQFVEEGWRGYSRETGQRIAAALGMTVDEL